MADTLKDFLVSLGWEINEDKQRRFVEAMRLADVQAKLLTDSLEALARKAAEAVAGIAETFDRLYFSSQRTGATAATIRDFGYAVSQLGGSAEEAQAALESMGQKLRDNRGNAFYFRNLGIEADQLTGKIKFSHAALENLRRMTPELQEQFRSESGFSERTLRALIDPKFEQFMREAEEARKRMGFDPDQAAKDANDFMTTWRRLSNDLGIVADDLLTKLMKALDEPLRRFAKFVEDHSPEIKDAIGKIAKAVGELAEKFEAWAQGVDWNEFGKTLKGVTDNMGALTKAFEAFFALWVVGKAGAAISGLRTLFAVLGLGGGLGAAAGATLMLGGDTSTSDPTPEQRTHAQKAYEKENAKQGGFWNGAWNWVKGKFGFGGQDAPTGGTQSGGGPSAEGAAGYWQVYNAAKAAGDRYPEVTAAQWALESGWGKHQSGKNNYFGQTTDGHPGHWASYDTPEAGLAAHMKRWGPKYGDASNAHDAIRNLVKNGYTPDAGYAESIDRIIGKMGSSPPSLDVDGDISGQSTYSHSGEKLNSINGFIVHHTAGGGSPSGVVSTLNARGLGVQFVMDRDGKIFRTLPDGSRGAHILPSSINDLSNLNTEGMEVIAKDDSDVTPAQVKAGVEFLKKFHAAHPGVQVFGHGEVNPGHRPLSEGMSIVNAYRRAMAVTPQIAKTVPAPTPLVMRTLRAYSTGAIDPAPVHNPWGDLNSYWGTPPLGGTGGNDKHVSLNSTNHFHIDGAGDPHAAAQMVAKHQTRLADDMTLNMIGAVN